MEKKLVQIIGWFYIRLGRWLEERECEPCEICGKWSREVHVSEFWHDDGAMMEVCPVCDVTEEEAENMEGYV